MKLCITKDRVGEMTQALFDKGYEVSIFSDFATVRREGSKSVYVDIVDTISVEDVIASAIAEVLASIGNQSDK